MTLDCPKILGRDYLGSIILLLRNHKTHKAPHHLYMPDTNACMKRSLMARQISEWKTVACQIRKRIEEVVGYRFKDNAIRE